LPTAYLGKSKAGDDDALTYSEAVQE
jgi:hypothetical protein